MEKKASITFTIDELGYLISSLELHEFNNLEDHDEEHRKFMKGMCMKFIKGLHRTGYTTATSNGLERFLKENY
jgi:hypothetical protein